MTPLEVLRNKEEGIMLYSPCYGNIIFYAIDNRLEKPIVTQGNSGYYFHFYPNGKIEDAGENEQIMLFPSINLKEWDKFNFKKGDILQHDGGMESVEFISYETSEENPANNYTMFKGKVITPMEQQGEIDYFTTWCFSPVKPLEKFKTEKFKPFDKVLYINTMSHYHIGFVEKCYKNGCIALMNVEDCVPNHVVFPYKEEMECLIGEYDNEVSKKMIKEILSNENN